MNNKLACVMLVDDNQYDNFFHKREIKKTNPDIIVIEKETGMEAIEYLKLGMEEKENLPDLIFLDINMPSMTGWEFLQAYQRLDKERHSRIIIVMLTTSNNDEDMAKAKASNIC